MHGNIATIRFAEQRDARTIAEVNLVTARLGYRGMLPDEALEKLALEGDEDLCRELLHPATANDRLFVAEGGDGVAGVIALGPVRQHGEEDRAAEILGLCVLPTWWGAGVGRALLDRAERELLALGFSEAIVWVPHDSPRARRFFEKAGWHFDGGSREAVRHGIHLEEMRYRRVLPPPVLS